MAVLRRYQGCYCPFCQFSIFKSDKYPFAFCKHCKITSMLETDTTVSYDAEYVAKRYDRYETTGAMSQLRLKLLEYVLYLYESLPQGKHSVQKGRLLDVGYGNGSFIREALKNGWDAYGNDVNPASYSEVRQIGLPLHNSPGLPYRAITFFDSLEHFEDLTTVRPIIYNTEWIVVSVPLPPVWFLRHPLRWKHYRPGEHHHYFHHPFSFENVFRTEDRGASVVYVACPEDTIRGKIKSGEDNIMTVFLRCHDIETLTGPDSWKPGMG